jgi:hypothetical protein
MAGTSSSPGSTGATLSVGNTTKAASGGVDAFAARLSFDLTTGGDAIAYYGGSGDERATAMTVADGKVWITGTTKSALPGMETTLGKVDGFAVGLDIATGDVAWSQRFSGKDGITNPTSIAVDAGAPAPWIGWACRPEPSPMGIRSSSLRRPRRGQGTSSRSEAVSAARRSPSPSRRTTPSKP